MFFPGLYDGFIWLFKCLKIFFSEWLLASVEEEGTEKCLVVRVELQNFVDFYFEGIGKAEDSWN